MYIGQWGDKTYENDYIEDIIHKFNLFPSSRKDLTTKGVEEILTNISSGEVYVGIVSFLIDNWKSPEEYLSKEVLKVALFYAERLIKDFDYANRWLYN